MSDSVAKTAAALAYHDIMFGPPDTDYDVESGPYIVAEMKCELRHVIQRKIREAVIAERARCIKIAENARTSLLDGPDFPGGIRYASMMIERWIVEP